MTFVLAVALTLTPTPVPNVGAEAGVAMQHIAAYVNDLDRAHVEATMYAEQQRFGEWLQAITPARVPVAVTRPSPPTGANGGGNGGSCYDGPIPAAIVTRESGGNPNAVNPTSGAYGCFQIMPFVYAANCADLDRTVAGQIACANRISNGGTNLQPWR